MLTEDLTALRILMNEDLYLTSEDSLREDNPDPVALVAEPVIIIEKEPAPNFVYLGKNLKNFLILTQEKLQENHLKALENTLGRKQLSLDDVAVVDFSAFNSTTFKELNAVFMPQKLVLFGLKPETLGLPKIELNTITSYENCKILYTYSLNEMLGNKEKTKAFWEPMKLI